MSIAESIVLTVVVVMAISLLYSIYVLIKFFKNDNSAYDYESYVDENGDVCERVIDINDVDQQNKTTVD